MTTPPAWELPPLSDAQLAKLAATLSDSELREQIVDATTGCTVDLHLYRLECGHLLDVRVNPLMQSGPGAVLDVYCPRGGHPPKRVRVVEHLLSIPGGQVGQPVNVEAAPQHL